METKDTIRFYCATKYRCHTPGIDSIYWGDSFATYDEAVKSGKECCISEDGLSIYLVYKDTYIFSCWPYSVKIDRNPCFVGSIMHPNMNISITTKINFDAFFTNPEKYLKYAEAIKSPQEAAHDS